MVRIQEESTWSDFANYCVPAAIGLRTVRRYLDCLAVSFCKRDAVQVSAPACAGGRVYYTADVYIPDHDRTVQKVLAFHPVLGREERMK